MILSYLDFLDHNIIEHLEAFGDAQEFAVDNEPVVPSNDEYSHESSSDESFLNESCFNEYEEDSYITQSASEDGVIPSSESHSAPTQIAMNAIFTSKKELSLKLKMYAIVNFFQYRTKSSSPTVLLVVCLGGNCKWSVRGMRLDDSGLFQIKRFDHKHTCSIDVRQANSRQATSSLIVELIKHHYGDADRKHYLPQAIMDDMKRMYGVYMTYKKAWFARELAMKLAMGSEKESYSRLPSLCHMLRSANPGSVVSYSCKENGDFEYFFMSLHAWQSGWEHCFPVMIVDGSFLKSYYKGTLLTACTQDANKQIFPLAFAICSVENTVNWTWFFTMLK
ncbi:unnamed protein product, partial [Cuscuta epithymum]